MIKIRLQRHGARHAPFYRMVVAPAQSRRDGRFIEVVGTYNPQSHVREGEIDLKMDRIDHWLGVGAKPTDTAKSLIRQGRLSPEDWLKRAEAKASAKNSRAARKKSPAQVEEIASVDAAVPAEEPKVEESPAPESKEESPAEEKAAEPEESKEEAPEAEPEAKKEKGKEPELAEEPKAEESPAPESKEESPAEEKAAEPEESKEEAPVEESKPKPTAKAQKKKDKES